MWMVRSRSRNTLTRMPEVRSMRPSRREFVKWVAASGIALGLSRLTPAQAPDFAATQTLPGAELESGRHRRRADRWRRQSYRRKALRVGFPRRPISRLAAEHRPTPCWSARPMPPMSMRESTSSLLAVRSSRLSSSPRTISTRVGTRVPDSTPAICSVPSARRRSIFGQPVALLIFEHFDAFDRARLSCGTASLEIRRRNRTA